VAKKAGVPKSEIELSGVPLRAGPPPRKKKSKAGGGQGRSAVLGGGEKDGVQRLQRVLASAGFGSRRHCEEMITEGRVEIDGETVTQLGTQVDPRVAKIYVDGNLLKKQRLVYFLLNKPPGVLTSNRDPQGRTRVIDLIQEPERVFPVGRLDRSSEGLLLLTNDGDLAQQLAHPKFGVRKIYRVTVAGKVDSDKLLQMKKGIYIAEGHVAVDGAKIVRHRGKSTDLEITLREGKNREIRRILARLGHKVMTLQRIALGPLRLSDLPRGAYRPLKSDELRRLREEVFYQSRAANNHADSEESEQGGETKKRPTGSAGSRPDSGKRTKTRTGPTNRKSSAVSSATGRGSTSGKKLQRPPKTINRGGSLTESKRIGTVIGDDPEPQVKEHDTHEKVIIRKRTAGKKTQAASAGGESGTRKSTGKRRSTGKRVSKKSAGQGAKKKRPRKDDA
jgi:23S rRNA pseudouridine2605 synthase